MGQAAEWNRLTAKRLAQDEQGASRRGRAQIEEGGCNEKRRKGQRLRKEKDAWQKKGGGWDRKRGRVHLQSMDGVQRVGAGVRREGMKARTG